MGRAGVVVLDSNAASLAVRPHPVPHGRELGLNQESQKCEQKEIHYTEPLSSKNPAIAGNCVKKRGGPVGAFCKRLHDFWFSSVLLSLVSASISNAKELREAGWRSILNAKEHRVASYVELTVGAK